MTSLTEEGLRFDFEDGWLATQYDKWHFYIKHVQNICGGAKAMDFVALYKGTMWLIEVKDLRVGPWNESEELWDVIACKARDTLVGLIAARMHANGPEQKFAEAALECRRIKVVFHVEQPPESTRIQKLYKPEDMTQKLKQRLRKIDDHPRIFWMSESHRYLNLWTVTEVPAT